MSVYLLLTILTFGGDTLLSLSWNEVGLYVPQGEDAGSPIGITAFGVGADGNIYLHACVENKVLVFDMNGRLVRKVETATMPCAWDITADAHGNIYALTYTPIKDSLALIWVIHLDGTERKIPIFDEFVEARGTGRLHASLKGDVFLEMFFGGDWHFVNLSEGSDAVRWFEGKGMVGWRGVPIPKNARTVNTFDSDKYGCVYSVTRVGTLALITRVCQNGKVFKGQWTPKMFVDFYDDPYQITPEGEVLIAVSDRDGFKLVKLRLSDDAF